MPTTHDAQQRFMLDAVTAVRASGRPAATLDKFHVVGYITGSGPDAVTHASDCGCAGWSPHGATCIVQRLDDWLTLDNLCHGALDFENLGIPGEYMVTVEYLETARAALARTAAATPPQWDQWVSALDHLTLSTNLLHGTEPDDPCGELIDVLTVLRAHAEELTHTVLPAWRTENFSDTGLAWWRDQDPDATGSDEGVTALVAQSILGRHLLRRATTQFGVASRSCGSLHVIRAPRWVLAQLNAAAAEPEHLTTIGPAVRSLLDDRLDAASAQLFLELLGDGSSVSIEDAQASALCASA